MIGTYIWTKVINVNIKDEILKYLCDDIKLVLYNISEDVFKETEEIRIFAERHIIFYSNSKILYVNKAGGVTNSYRDLYVPSMKDIEFTLRLMCNNSIYSETDNIKNGFLTLPHGYRVGITGTAVLSDGKISYIKNISCMNIRISREIKGVSKKIIDYIINDGKVNNTLIISPPQCGKTTYLRDIAKTLGNEIFNKKVGIVDERNEIASVVGGRIINDIGIHTFVINNCSKDEGINILIRTMSPDVIITDEIGNKKDIVSIKKALCSGVSLITSIHSDYNDFVKSDYAKIIIDFFDIFVFLTRKNGPGTIENILNRGELFHA